MFAALDLSPMLILLLLVYGLLIAFSLFAWSALNLRQRARDAQQSGQAGPEAGKQTGRTQQPPERREPARQQRGIPARQDTPPVRPAPEVQVRVRGTSDAPAPQQKPWLRTPEGPETRPDAVSLRKPEAPARKPEAPAGRKPNEDAFERFLRSSRNDPED